MAPADTPPRCDLVSDGVPHAPDRPSWDCKACGKEWPCDPARERMAVEAAQDGPGGLRWLAMRMWGYLEDFSLDVGPGPLKEAFERFIGWTRPPEC